MQRAQCLRDLGMSIAAARGPGPRGIHARPDHFEAKSMSNAAQATDRVRANTDTHVNADIDRAIAARVRAYASLPPDAIARRIAALDREWDVERWLETIAPTLAMGGIVLGMMRSRRWLVLPAVVLPFLLQHAVSGWCPPLPVLRRLGVRTREEIDRERYALKVLRGDFDRPPASTASPGRSDEHDRAHRALRAVFMQRRHDPYGDPGPSHL
jgi:hypothetical protein